MVILMMLTSFPTLQIPLNIALVGGFVRDTFLNRASKDLDYVVWGATPEEVRRAIPGAQVVGRDFPVFVLPGGAQVALARRERKVGLGYEGFAVDIDTQIDLPTDLSRRDLTINAMALLPDGTLVDPFGGRQDLEARVLRHVGPAFVEDPLRVYRLARFAAQLGFSVHAETVALARQIPRAEFEALSAELPKCGRWKSSRRLKKPRVDFTLGRLSNMISRGISTVVWPFAPCRYPKVGGPVFKPGQVLSLIPVLSLSTRKSCIKLQACAAP
jgi:hypothetical protein